MPKHPNTFEAGLNSDISDLVIPPNVARSVKNMRMLDLDGTSYAITSIKGTELKFTLSTGYTPIASVAYGDILYIMSGTPKVGVPGSIGDVEIGSFPSPDYSSGDPSQNIWEYRAFNNLDDSSFVVDFFNLTESQFVDIGIQPDYDGSVNVILTAKNNPPRMVNSKFNKDFEIIERREGANTNDYTSASVDTETRLVLRSQQITNISFVAVENGGKLLPGNYTYIFRYATADFNETDVFNQSGVCSVFEGYDTTKYKASVNVETTKRTRLLLSNIDVNFAYIKVYFKYNRGEDSNTGNTYELVQPIPISGRTSFELIHDGFEETNEVSEDAINVDFTAFDNVATHTQARSYLILGNVEESPVNYDELLSASQTVTPSKISRNLGTALNPYASPSNIYNYLGCFGNETYPYGIVYVMNDGSLSPVFPVQGYDEYNWQSLTTEQQDDIKSKGLYRYTDINDQEILTTSGVFSKAVKFTISSISQSVKDKTLGFFIVRAERKADLLSQGILIPTIKTPPYDYTRSEQIDDVGDNGNYYDNFSDESEYKYYPLLDSIVEPWVMFNDGSYDSGNNQNVITTDGTNRIDKGYMPSPLKNFTIPGYSDASDNEVKNKYHWGYFSADYILNEARYISALQRSNLGFTQWKQVEMESVTDGTIKNKWKAPGFDGGAINVDTSLLYKITELNSLSSGNNYSNSISSIDYVPVATFATGHKFISGLSVRFKKEGDHRFQARSFADAYFGIKVAGLNGLLDNNNPRQQPYNITVNPSFPQIEGPMYANVGRKSNLGYLVSIYPRSSGLPITDINQIYDTINGLSYRQVTDRLTWTQAGSEVEVYGGDCYIGEVHKRINISGYNDPKEPSDVLTPSGGKPAAYGNDISADNINQGVTFSFIQECEYNSVLRLPYLGNTSDPEERSFFPYKGEGDYNKYRDYRLQETNKTNQGHSETKRPKVFIPLPTNAPFISQKFFTRLIHSEKHIPNAFQNGYRSYVGVNHEDYTPDMGEIVRLFTHRDQIVIVFEHGIAVGPVKERIQTASDSAGAIFVEPSGVLPPNLGIASREIGSQNGNSIVQTPSSIYGIDVSRRKIWQFREGLLIISDNGFQNLMDKSSLLNPRLGYDPQYHEVIFTTDEWTLCFKEGLEKFTSFYSFKSNHYARRSSDLYSFNSSTQQFDIHNADIREIHGNIEQSYIEFVFNPSANSAKVVDFLEIVSNEVSPKTIDLYTYNIDTRKDDIIDIDDTFQHVAIEEGVDFYTQEDRIKFRDRKFIVQIPNITYINSTDWSEGRFRDKYAIIRLTYETNQKVELLSVITDFRFSAS